MTALDPAALVRDLVALPGPPGQEDTVRHYLRERLERMGVVIQEDAKGNLLAAVGKALPEAPTVVVTAHMDEIALLVTHVDADGELGVGPLGGVFPWKWGEGPVEILARDGVLLPGIASLGSIHTTSPASPARQARDGVAPTWEGIRIITGLTAAELYKAGVRPGTRVVLARSRRTVTELGGGLVSAFFLDDRVDLVSWLLALTELRETPGIENILWAATASEEVGGEGALFLLQKYRPDICVALEIGPTTPDAPFPIDATPTVWVTDSYATMSPRDLDLLSDAACDAGLPQPHWQAVTRGGSDASCAASHGLCARPVTLAFAAENSHGCEIMHRDAPENLAHLTVAYLKRVLGGR